MRTINKELAIRKKQRETYFEDPSYRKWSDVALISTIYAGIGDWSELAFFTSYFVGTCEGHPNLSRIRSLLQNGKQLPINWKTVYDYFDERYLDDENILWEEFYHGLCDAGDVSGQSLVSLLNEFRSELIDEYDLI